MENKIVQIELEKYNRIVAAANRKSKDIENKAIELYKERGSASIVIRFETDRDIDGNYTVELNSRLVEADGRFTIPYEFRKRVEKIIDNELDYIIKRKIGDLVKLKKQYAGRLQSFKYWKFFYLLISITGWLSFIIALNIGK